MAGSTAIGAAAFDLDFVMDVVGGDLDLLQALLDLHWSTIDDSVAILRASLSAGDARGTHQTAHRLKGSVGNLGGCQVCQTLSELCESGRKGNLNGSVDQLARLESELAAFHAELRAFQRETCEGEGVGGDVSGGM